MLFGANYTVGYIKNKAIKNTATTKETIRYNKHKMEVVRIGIFLYADSAYIAELIFIQLILKIY